MDKKTQIGLLCIEVAKQEAVDIAIRARAIGTMIFDIPYTKSGFVSAACVDEYGYRPSYNKLTAEHFYSRNESGYLICHMVAKGEPIWDFLDECTTVHYTTADENQKLCKIQNHPATKHLSWQEQYELAGVELVEDPGTMPIKMRNQLKKEVK